MKMTIGTKICHKPLSRKDLGQSGAAPLVVSAYATIIYDKKNFLKKVLDKHDNSIRIRPLITDSAYLEFSK